MYGKTEIHVQVVYKGEKVSSSRRFSIAVISDRRLALRSSKATISDRLASNLHFFARRDIRDDSLYFKRRPMSSSRCSMAIISTWKGVVDIAELCSKTTISDASAV
uniref:Uncharacterized protein n=1 Tax=Romanomermis culicivorax TaxID=13658 RepID=A0A915KWB0_ROMCU